MVDNNLSDEEIEAEVANLVGFNSIEEYRQAKEVVANGIPELIAAMDVKRISIAIAAQISRLPVEMQYEMLAQLSN